MIKYVFFENIGARAERVLWWKVCIFGEIARERGISVAIVGQPRHVPLGCSSLLTSKGFRSTCESVLTCKKSNTPDTVRERGLGRRWPTFPTSTSRCSETKNFCSFSYVRTEMESKHRSTNSFFLLSTYIDGKSRQRIFRFVILFRIAML